MPLPTLPTILQDVEILSHTLFPHGQGPGLGPTREVSCSLQSGDLFVQVCTHTSPVTLSMSRVTDSLPDDRVPGRSSNLDMRRTSCEGGTGGTGGISGRGGAWVICGPEGPVWIMPGARRGTTPLLSLGAEAGAWASLPFALPPRWVWWGGSSTVQSESSPHPPTHPLTTDTERKHPSSRCCRSPLAPPSKCSVSSVPPYLDPFTCKSQPRAMVFVHLGFLGLSSLPTYLDGTVCPTQSG